MKVPKIIILLISILFPVLVTTFIGFYSYGSVGGWEKNQDRFIENYFNNKYETPVQIENSVKYSAYKYQKNVTNTSFRDPITKEDFALTDGILNLNNAFSIKSYAILNKFDDKYTVEYKFFLYNIAYGTKEDPIIDMGYLYFLFVDGTGEEADKKLDAAIQTAKTNLIDENTVGGVTYNAQQSGYRPIYDNNADDPENADKAHYVYTFIPNRSYPFDMKNDDDETISYEAVLLEKCLDISFAIVQEIDDDDEPIKVWVEGTLSNLKSNTTSNNDKNYNRLENVFLGFNSDIKAAGYNKFVWPTILWQSAVAFVVSGILSYLFYNIWTMEEEDTTILKPQPKKKVRK